MGIAVESEDDGLILGEDGVVLGIAEAVGMLVVGLQLEQVHHVDHANLQLGHLVTQDGDSGHGLQGWGYRRSKP